MNNQTKRISNSDIIDCVESLITTNGVNSFSLKDVASSLGISQGTLYYHYQSKDAMVLDLMKKHMDQLKGDYLSWMERHKDGSVTFERFLEVIFYKGVRLFNKAKIHLYLINECLSVSESLRTEYLRMWDEWKSTIEEGLRFFFPSIKNPKTLSYLIMLLTDGLTVQEALMSKSDDEEDLIKMIGKLKEE
jgi:AcrR family transcriptional regulator